MATSHDGLGLEYGTVRLVRSRPEWSAIADGLAATARRALGDHVVKVEHIGSTAVPGMLAKPIIDLAAGHRPGDGPRDRGIRPAIRAGLESIGWRYRGDAGDAGGHVFVLERGAGMRIAHLHVADHGGAQWRRWLALRDRLHGDPAARSSYERAKLALLAEHAGDNSRRAYTLGKTAIIHELLRGGP